MKAGVATRPSNLADLLRVNAERAAVRRAERSQLLRLMVGGGAGLSDAAERLGIQPDSLAEWCRENGLIVELEQLRDQDMPFHKSVRAKIIPERGPIAAWVFECPDCGASSPPSFNRGVPFKVALGHDCGKTCPECGYRSSQHGGRGLCSGCHRDREVRMDYETKFWRADDMLDTWDELRREGHTVRQAAERMGVTFAALDKALCRGKRRGDPRARRPGERAGAA